MLERKSLISAGIVLQLIVLAGSINPAYAIGPPGMPEGIGVFVSMSLLKQSVEAGGTAFFHMTVMDLGSYYEREPFEGWVNLTVGVGPVESSDYTPLGWSELHMQPLPEGLTANISNVYVQRNMVESNFSIHVAPDMPEFDILIVVKAEGTMDGGRTMRFATAQLHVTPSSIPVNTTRTYLVLTKTVTQPRTVVTTTVHTTTTTTIYLTTTVENTPTTSIDTRHVAEGEENSIINTLQSSSIGIGIAVAGIAIALMISGRRRLIR